MEKASHLHSKLTAIVADILHGSQKCALSSIPRLRDVLVGSSRITLDDTKLSSGRAVSPYVASLCVNDSLRTIAFLKGNYAAIKAKLKQVKNRPVYVLDAGSGPLGAITLPLATQFSPYQVRFIPADIHMESIRSLKDTTRRLGLNAHIEKLIITDLTTYHHSGIPLDVVTSETMGSALLYEPQTQITAHLASQLDESVIWTPERIAIRGYLCKEDSSEEVYDFGDFFEVTKEHAPHIFSVQLELPQCDHKVDLYLGTKINVYKENVIYEGESTITQPVRISRHPINCKKYRTMHLEYHPGSSIEQVSLEFS